MLAGPTNIYRCADVITWKIFNELSSPPSGLFSSLTSHGEADEVRADAEARTLARRHADGG